MKYRKQGVRVDASSTGWGVFALRELGAKELLGPIDGWIMDDAQYESDYCMALGEHQALEPAPPFRYVNHSCHPNCALVEMKRKRDALRPSLWVEIKAGIAPGEELTIDYAWPAASAIPCRCGCSDCRQWIVAADELDQVLARTSTPIA